MHDLNFTHLLELGRQLLLAELLRGESDLDSELVHDEPTFDDSCLRFVFAPRVLGLLSLTPTYTVLLTRVLTRV